MDLDLMDQMDSHQHLMWNSLYCCLAFQSFAMSLLHTLICCSVDMGGKSDQDLVPFYTFSSHTCYKIKSALCCLILTLVSEYFIVDKMSPGDNIIGPLVTLHFPKAFIFMQTPFKAQLKC